MRVLVTGGSGYVGGAVVRALVAAGHKVTGIARSKEAQQALARLDAHARPGDLTLPASLTRAAEGQEAIVHCGEAHGPDRAAIDRAAIETLIAAARASGEARVVIYTSGYWSLGQGGGDEDSACDHPARYSQHRPALERDVLAAAGDRLVTAVVRPGMVYGGKMGVAHYLLRYLPEQAGRPGTPTFVGGGENRWTPVHRDDVGQLYKLLLERRARGLYHAVEDEPLAARAIAHMLAEAGRLPAPLGWPLKEAEAKIGPALAEAFALDVPATAPRARSLGWKPTHRFAAEVSQTFTQYKGD